MGINASRNLAQASVLKGMAADFGNISNQMNVLATNLHYYFMGLAGDACRSALERRKNEISNIQTKARSIASEISSVVAEIKAEEAEERRSRGSSGGGHVSSDGPGMCL